MGDVTFRDEPVDNELGEEIAATLGLNLSAAGDDDSETDASTEEPEEEEEVNSEDESEEEDEALDEGDEMDEENEEEEDDLTEDKGTKNSGVKALEEQISALEERLSKLVKQETPEVKEEPKEEEPSIEIPDVPNFVTEEDFQDIVTDPDAFNKAVNKAVKWALEEALTRSQKGQKSTLEQARQLMRQEMPQIMRQVQLSEKQQEAVRKQFWDRNNDTINGLPANVQGERRKLVATIAGQVASEQPSFSYQQLIDEVEKRYRAALGVGKSKGKNGSPGKRNRKGPRKPRQASSSSRRPSGGGGKKDREIAPNSPEDIAQTLGIR